MTVDSIGGASPASSATTGSATPGQQADALGRDTFLQLLITQLQHQDPTQPQDNSEFIAQLAQFSSLEQLSNIETSVSAITRMLQGAQQAGSTSSTEGQA